MQQLNSVASAYEASLVSHAVRSSLAIFLCNAWGYFLVLSHPCSILRCFQWLKNKMFVWNVAMGLSISILNWDVIQQSRSINELFFERDEFSICSSFSLTSKFIAVNMFKFLSFENILLVANAVMNISGFFCISIDPATFKRRKSFGNNFYFLVTVVFSLAAYSYRSMVPIRSITHSRILETLVNTLNSLAVYSLFILKVFNIFQYRDYRRILENLQWCNLNVRL